jgi:large repetitive protein
MRKEALTTIGTAVMGLIAAAPAGATPPTMEFDTYRMSSSRASLTVPAPGVLANDSDADGDPLRAVLQSGSTYGTVDLRPSGRFTYTPQPDFTGLDQFTYAATDNPHDVPPCCGHVYIIITAPPQAADDSYAAVNRRTRTVPAPGLMANDTAERVRMAEPPEHGTVDLFGTGRFAYTADPGFVGTDSFKYEAIVQGEQPAPATVTMRVKRSNAKPEAVADTFETDEDIPLTIPAPGLLANDVDSDGDPLTALSVTAPFGDGFTMGADGSFEYYPPPNFDSPVSFKYQVDDGLARSDAATVQIEIHAVDDAPTAQDDEYSLGGATTLDIPAPGVLGNDFDEVEGDSLRLRHNGGPSKGTLDLRPDGAFTYVRDPGARGQDRFRYQVSDSGGAQGNIAYVWIRP